MSKNKYGWRVCVRNKGRQYQKSGIEREEDAIALVYALRLSLGLTISQHVRLVGKANMSAYIEAIAESLLTGPPRKRKAPVVV